MKTQVLGQERWSCGVTTLGTSECVLVDGLSMNEISKMSYPLDLVARSNKVTVNAKWASVC